MLEAIVVLVIVVAAAIWVAARLRAAASGDSPGCFCHLAEGPAACRFTSSCPSRVGKTPKPPKAPGE